MADCSKKKFRSELSLFRRAVEYLFEDDDAWDESAVDAASAIDVDFAVEDAMKMIPLTSESPLRPHQENTLERTNITPKTYKGAAVKESTVSTTTAKAETPAKGAALSEKAAAANGEKVVRSSQVIKSSSSSSSAKGAVNASSKKPSLLSSLNSFKSKAPNPDEVKHAKVGGGLINKFRTVEMIALPVNSPWTYLSDIQKLTRWRSTTTECHRTPHVPISHQIAAKEEVTLPSRHCCEAFSSAAPGRLRVLSRDRDALALILRTHRERNLVPFIDWTLHGFFPGLGRDNRFLGGGADEDDDESDEDTEGGEDADQRDEDGNGEEDHDHHPPQPPPPPPLLPPPLVRGLPPVVRPLARGSAKPSYDDGSQHSRWRCCDFDCRWDGYWSAEDRSARAVDIRREIRTQWKSFEEHVLRVIGHQSPQAWEQAAGKAKEQARERLREIGTVVYRVIFGEVGGALAAAEEEARLHALVTEALDPNLVEPFHVNMLPFEMGHHCSLPLKCRRYSGIIDLCLQHCPKEVGNVGYLTIDEGWVEPSETQRRPGLHIEAHCDVLTGTEGSGHSADQFFELKPEERLWGAGSGPDVLNIEGGIFQASNVSGSCRVWDCVLRDPCGAVGPHGSVEHLRSLLDRGAPASFVSLPIPVANRPEHLHDSEQRNPAPKRGTQHPAAEEGSRWRGSTKLAAHELVWMTDHTPHEALPVSKRVFRQFFRLVTSRVTVWYAAHSTRNDGFGVVPPSDVIIVAGDKFAGPGGTETVRRAASEPLAFI
ncbi:hypothetical protein DFJ73DRAFT_944724 [Zopfochytrium polystomum]|nr:hypothetical protein DFJ73DRAFT_944724 [Zopfochytrium polystomum]